MDNKEKIVLCFFDKEVLSSYKLLLEKVESVLSWNYDLNICRSGRNCIDFISANTSTTSTVMVETQIPWELYTKNQTDTDYTSFDNALRLLKEIKLKNPLINLILISRSGKSIEIAHKDTFQELASNYLNHIQFERKHVNRYVRESLKKNNYTSLESFPEIKYLNEFIQALSEMRNRYFTDIRLTSKVQSFDALKEILVPSQIRQDVIRAGKARATQKGLPTVLLIGPVGTGKTSIGKVIQGEDDLRRKQPFWEVNLTTIPPDMIAAELFGYKNTKKFSPIRDKVGLFQKANGGILFIDEISALPMETQEELIRVIKTHSILRINTKMRIAVNVKIIAASSYNLSAKIASGEFSSELYDILSSIEIQIPALSERSDDIVKTINFYCKKYSRNVTNDVISYYLSHPPKENLRELKTVIERLATISSSKLFNITDLLKVIKTIPKKKKTAIEPKKGVTIAKFLSDYLDNISTIGANKDNYDFNKDLFPIFTEILNAIGEQQFSLNEHINLDNISKGIRKYLIFLYYAANKEKLYSDTGLAKILGINDVSIRKIVPKKTIQQLLLTKR